MHSNLCSSDSILPSLHKYFLSISCVPRYFLVKQNPTNGRSEGWVGGTIYELRTISPGCNWQSPPPTRGRAEGRLGRRGAMQSSRPAGSMSVWFLTSRVFSCACSFISSSLSSLICKTRTTVLAHKVLWGSHQMPACVYMGE